MRLHYKAREGETIQYVDVMSLYPYVCKNCNFLVGHSDMWEMLAKARKRVYAW